jgi:hypothetical protein
MGFNIFHGIIVIFRNNLHIDFWIFTMVPTWVLLHPRPSFTIKQQLNFRFTSGLQCWHHFQFHKFCLIAHNSPEWDYHINKKNDIIKGKANLVDVLHSDSSLKWTLFSDNYSLLEYRSVIYFSSMESPFCLWRWLVMRNSSYTLHCFPSWLCPVTGSRPPVTEYSLARYLIHSVKANYNL